MNAQILALSLAGAALAISLLSLGFTLGVYAVSQ